MAFFVKPMPPYKTPVRRPLRELKPKEKELVERRKAEVHKLIPELVPIIKEMYEFGMINGWRSVGNVKIFKKG